MGVREELFIDVTDKNTLRRTTNRTKAADKATKSYLNTAKLLAGAYVAMKAIKIGAEFANQAAQAQRADKALAAYIGGAEKATRATLAMQNALGGTVSEFEATQLATKLIALNLARTGDEAAGLAGKVAALGSVFGKEATPAIEEFTLLLANNSILRLDTFGISAVVVKTRIKELQAATKGLTRDQAFQAATFEQLEIKAALLGDVFNDDAAIAGRYDAVLADLSITVGDKLAPAFNAAKIQATGFITGLDVLLGGGNAAQEIGLLTARIQALQDIAFIPGVSGKIEDLQKELDFAKGTLAVNERQAEILARQAEIRAEDDAARQLRRDALNVELEINFQLLTEDQKRLLVAIEIAKVEGRIAIAKEASIKATIEQAVLGQGTVKEAVSQAIRLEAAKATAGYIAGAFTSLPLPLALIASAGAGAVVGGLFDALIPSFAHGGDFTTSGPQLIQVGDNASGRERVQITPDPVAGGAQDGVTYNFYGTVIGEEEWIRNNLNPIQAQIQATG